MGRFERALVALTAAAALAITAMLGTTLVRLWRHPPVLHFTATESGAAWRGAGLSAELVIGREGFERLTVWRELSRDGQMANAMP